MLVLNVYGRGPQGVFGVRDSDRNNKQSDNQQDDVKQWAISDVRQ